MITESSSKPSLTERVFKSRREAEDFFSGLSECITDVRIVSTDPQLDIGYAGGTLGVADIHRGAVPALEWRANESDCFHFLLPQRGRVIVAEGKYEAEAGRAALLLSPSTSGRADVPERLNGISLIASRSALAAQAGKVFGRDIRQGDFLSGIFELPLADPLTMALSRNLAVCVHEMLTLDKLGIAGLARTQFDDLLVNLLTTIVLPELRAGSSQAEAGSPIVIQARDYIRDHASEPLRLTDLAERLGIGLRTLQMGFRKHVGVSPREYLMQCRLELARSRLLAANPETTIAAVAFDCGFTDLSLFSRKYRHAFGELPSATLRRR